MREGGIGGFELAVVYPMALDDPGRGVRNERYLSPEFLEEVAFASHKARELGLRMDVTIGSGWSFGGRTSRRSGFDPTALRPPRDHTGPDECRAPLPFEGDRLIAAYIGRGSLAEVDPTTFRELDISGAGRSRCRRGRTSAGRAVLLRPDGPGRQARRRRSRRLRPRSLPARRIETHLHEAGDKLLPRRDRRRPRRLLRQPGSLRRGLDRGHVQRVPEAARLWPARLAAAARVRCRERSETLRRDFGRTLSELYEERFLVPMREWAARNKSSSASRTTGAARLAGQLRYADLIDGEGWNFRTLTSARWASSASHLFGKP